MENLNPSQIGDITELKCQAYLIEQGWNVLIPIGNHQKYDLVIEKDCKFYRIQVKHACKNSNGSYTIYTANSVATTTKREVKHYVKEDVDFIASIIEDQLVIIPVEEISNCKQKIFRAVLPTQGQTAHCNLISNYTVERYIL